MQNQTSLVIGFLSLLSLCFLTIIFYKWMKKKSYPPLPPGPMGYPVIGCLPELLKNKPTYQWIHNLMQELNTEIACIRLGNTHVIPVTSPDLAREFLKKHDAIFASRPDNMSAKLISNGYLGTVVSPMGNQWKKMRRIMASEVLSPAMHQWLYEKRREEADHLVRYVYNQCLNGAVNVRDATIHYCGNMTRKLVFGKRFFGRGMENGGPGIEEREHVDVLFTVLKYVYGFGIGDYVPWLQVFDLDGHRKIVSNAFAILGKYHDSEISDRVEKWRQGVRSTKDDILDVLINLKDSNNNPILSIQEIKTQINEILLATMDNPSNAVEWAIAEMISQPQILDKAYKELDQIVGKDRLVQESDLSKLNYIKACIKEAFRLHPVAPFNLPHVSTKDTIVGGYFIPRGSHVLLSRIGLGQNPRIWDDSLKYKPERHITDEALEVTLVDSELQMLSFSAGRRGCPGIVLGSTMSTMLLARLIHCFNWKTPKIDLSESSSNLQLAKPLIAQAMPRLESQVYQQLL